MNVAMTLRGPSVPNVNPPNPRRMNREGRTPPLIPDEPALEWLSCLVNRLRTEFGATAEEYPCVFLTDDMRCAIYELERPRVCREFRCEEGPTR